jgi:CheY-like chemotaxis protein
MRSAETRLRLFTGNANRQLADQGLISQLTIKQKQSFVDTAKNKLDLAKIYVKAQADGTEDSIALLAPHLEEDALLTMALGPVPGKQSILTQMKNPVTMYNFTVINWDEPVADGDVVVLDKEMAGSSGLDVLRHMRERHPQTPVVLVTAFGGAEVEAEARGQARHRRRPRSRLQRR